MQLIGALRRCFMVVGTLVATAGLTGCFAIQGHYVDPVQPVLASSQLPAVRHREPVTVLFQWLTNGKANPGAASTTRGHVVAAVTDSGMFTRVSQIIDSPRPNILSLTIDDRADVGKTEAKGFASGLTWGLVGIVARDDYVCTASYTSAGKTTGATSRAAILTTVGIHTAPSGLKPVKAADGVNEVISQLVWHSLEQLAREGAFGETSR